VHLAIGGVKNRNHNPQQGLGSPLRNPADGAFWTHLSFSAESLCPERFSPGSFAPVNFAAADFYQQIFTSKVSPADQALRFCRLSASPKGHSLGTENIDTWAPLTSGTSLQELGM
jgi:hypothetical protein